MQGCFWVFSQILQVGFNVEKRSIIGYKTTQHTQKNTTLNKYLSFKSLGMFHA